MFLRKSVRSLRHRADVKVEATIVIAYHYDDLASPKAVIGKEYL